MFVKEAARTPLVLLKSKATASQYWTCVCQLARNMTNTCELAKFAYTYTGELKTKTDEATSLVGTEMVKNPVYKLFWVSVSTNVCIMW